jgi:hypothetical protein
MPDGLDWRLEGHSELYSDYIFLARVDPSIQGALAARTELVTCNGNIVDRLGVNNFAGCCELLLPYGLFIM